MTDLSAPHGSLSRRNLLFAALSAGSNGLLLVLQALAGQTLHDVVFGQFAFAISLATISETLMDLGIHQVTIRSVARDRSTAVNLFHNSLSLKLLPGAAMFALMTGVAFWWRPEPEVRLACVLLLVSTMLRSYLLTIRGVLQGLEQFSSDLLVVLADRVLLLGFGAFALLKGGGLVGLAEAFVASRVVAIVLAFIVASRSLGLPAWAADTAVWRELLTRALPLGAFLLVLNLYSYIDNLILYALGSDAETGRYKAAYTLYEGLTYAPAILSSVLTPRLSHLWGHDRPQHARLTRRALFAAVGLGVPLAAGTWLLATPAVHAIWGADYAASAAMLRVLVVGLPLACAIWTLQAVAISVFEERWLLWTTLWGSAVNIGLNVLLIPSLGGTGAAIATVIGEGFSLLILGWGLRRALAAGGRAQ